MVTITYVIANIQLFIPLWDCHCTIDNLVMHLSSITKYSAEYIF